MQPLCNSLEDLRGLWRTGPDNFVACVTMALSVRGAQHIVKNMTMQIQQEKQLSHEDALMRAKLLVILKKAQISLC